MTNIRSGAWALIAGSILMGLVFIAHPAQHHPAAVLGAFNLSQLVHGTALVASPLIAYGLWELAEWLGLRRATVRIALVFSLLAMTLTINAAVVSNFVTPVAIEASRDAARAAGHAAAPVHPPMAQTSPHDPGTTAVRPIPNPLGRVAVAFNRGFAQVHVGMLSLGLLLFGLALFSRARLLGGFGMAIGAYPLLWQLSGSFSPETTTMPWIALPQSAWLIAVSLAMLRVAKQDDQ